jgi:hypothetical protein
MKNRDEGNGGGHRRRRPSPEPRKNWLIDEDSAVRSTNQTHRDEALDETNTVVPSDFDDDARIGSNCSPELPSELKQLHASVSNSGRWGMNVRKPF